MEKLGGELLKKIVLITGLLLRRGDKTMNMMQKYIAACGGMLLALSAPAYGQQGASVTLETKTITVDYAVPAAGNRVVGIFHTPSDLAFKGLNVPKGLYTLYVLMDGPRWQLAVNKATGDQAAAYDPKQDLGRVPMLMIRPLAPAEGCKITLSKIAPIAAEMKVVCNDKAASTSFRLDRGANDSQW
jgi:hypothetical protein